MKRLLIIGQTPPPYGGQSINIEKIILLLRKHNIPHQFIRMDFSDELSENGKVSLKKIIRLIKIFIRILVSLAFYRPHFVYYPPCGPEKVAIIRDIFLLLPVRLFNFKVVFHFHAGGIREAFPMLGTFFRRVFKFTYFYPTHSICLSNEGKKDAVFLNSKNITLIPSGVNTTNLSKDAGGMKKTEHTAFTVLFAGVCRESKGVLDFIKIVEKAHAKNSAITGKIIGSIFSDKEGSAINEAVKRGLIEYDGVKIGLEKDNIFKEADLFLFPTFFEHENFPTVNLEAFSYGLPVVSTKWRGVIDQVVHNYNGYIHDIHDIEGMAQSVVRIASDVDLCRALSLNAKNDFKNMYTQERFEQNIIKFFTSVK